MNGQLVLCVLAILLPVSVMGHAQLDEPRAFNPNPSKTATCGGVGAGPINVLPAGTTQTLYWKIIAGDGAGALSMLVDPAGLTTGFPSRHDATLPAGSQAQIVSLTPLDGTPQTVGSTYRHTFTWPAGLVCTNANGACTAQVFSTSDWVACFAFTLTAPVQSGTATSTGSAVNGACVIAQAVDVPFCTTITGQRVFVPTGFTVRLLDDQVQSTVATNLVNRNVFTNFQDLPPVGAYSPCYNSYTRFLCGNTFSLCNAQNRLITGPGSGVCLNSCQEFICWCGLTEIHKGLYPSCAGFSAAVKDSSGNCTTFGPNNARCVAAPTTSTGSQCGDLFCSSPRSAILQPFLLAIAALVTVAMLYANF